MTFRPRRSFTLMELLVVIGIIVILTALSVPAITKFLRGQSLTQSGRIVQSAFNEARRAAITQRAKNYLVFFRQPDDARPGEYLYGMIRYREKKGYEGEAHFLLPGVQFDIDESTTAGGAASGIVGQLMASHITVFDGIPPENSGSPFTSGFVPVTPTGRLTWVEFQRDGTIALKGDTVNPQLPIVNGENLFDRNVDIQVGETTFDTLRNQVDINLRESGGGPNVDKRCFIDIDENTGRVRFRVLQIHPDGDATGGTTTGS
ncbi:MAG: hypothetical protein D6731_10535 [Planctomycetota bacterium]|nr:MAG: hypothetical protein D6731_10535 [Planctomycetota bacterium]